MAESRRIVRVFLASPGDLKQERQLTKKIVDEINNLWGEETGYFVELVGWEDTVSAVGRPQELINRDLEGCEFFIGLMWKRCAMEPPRLAETLLAAVALARRKTDCKGKDLADQPCPLLTLVRLGANP